MEYQKKLYLYFLNFKCKIVWILRKIVMHIIALYNEAFLSGNIYIDIFILVFWRCKLRNFYQIIPGK